MKRAKTQIDGKSPKEWMDYMFDHTLVVAEDDPELLAFQQMAIPFLIVGHVHLSLNVYKDIHEIIISLGLNILVAVGFIIDYRKNGKK